MTAIMSVSINNIYFKKKYLIVFFCAVKMVIRPGYCRICLFTVFLLFFKCCFIRWSMSKKLFL